MLPAKTILAKFTPQQCVVVYLPATCTRRTMRNMSLFSECNLLFILHEDLSVDIRKFALGLILIFFFCGMIIIIIIINRLNNRFK